MQLITTRERVSLDEEEKKAFTTAINTLYHIGRETTDTDLCEKVCEVRDALEEFVFTYVLP